jgi:hypothetical protein
VPAGSVATVDEDKITQAEFDHWARISARQLRVRLSKPPAYAKCVAKKGGTKKRRKARCAAEFRKVRDETMAFLIPAHWIELEAVERSIVVTDDEVRAEVARQREATFKTDAEWLDYKDDTGLTDADIRFKVRKEMLSNRVRDQVLEESHTTNGQGAVLESFSKAYRSKWIPRTTCAPSYKTLDCRR